MNRQALPLLAVLAVLAAGAARADEPTAPADKPAAAQPADAKPAEAPMPAAAPAAEASSCLVPGPAAEGKGCAAAYQAVADGYLEAYKGMEVWIADASTKVAGAADKVAAIEKSVRDNEAQMTDLKLKDSPDAKERLRDLEKANRDLWRELSAARRDEKALCRALGRDAAQKVRELSAGVTQRLGAAQKQAQ